MSENKLEKPEKSKKSKSKPEPRLAMRDFLIVQNEYRREIKKGENISDVPEKFLQNLVTEGVLSKERD